MTRTLRILVHLALLASALGGCQKSAKKTEAKTAPDDPPPTTLVGATTASVSVPDGAFPFPVAAVVQEVRGFSPPKGLKGIGGAVSVDFSSTATPTKPVEVVLHVAASAAEIATAAVLVVVDASGPGRREYLLGADSLQFVGTGAGTFDVIFTTLEGNATYALVVPSGSSLKVLSPPAAPASASGADVSAAAATVQWQAVEGASGFVVAYAPAPVVVTGCSFGTVVGAAEIGSATSFRLEGLVAGTSYVVHVCAIQDIDGARLISKPIRAEFVTSGTPPGGGSGAGNTTDTGASTGGPGRPPIVSGFAIAGGAAFTRTRDVTLTIAGTEDAQELAVAESADCSGGAWQVLAPSLPFTLSAGDGPKTLCVKLRDIDGESGAVTATITLDTTAPILGALRIAADAADGLAAALDDDLQHFFAWDAAIDGGSGIGGYAVSWFPRVGCQGSGTDIEAVAGTAVAHEGVKGGTYSFVLTARDAVGNEVKSACSGALTITPAAPALMARSELATAYEQDGSQANATPIVVLSGTGLRPGKRLVFFHAACTDKGQVDLNLLNLDFAKFDGQNESPYFASALYVTPSSSDMNPIGFWDVDLDGDANDSYRLSVSSWDKKCASAAVTALDLGDAGFNDLVSSPAVDQGDGVAVSITLPAASPGDTWIILGRGLAQHFPGSTSVGTTLRIDGVEVASAEVWTDENSTFPLLTQAAYTVADGQTHAVTLSFEGPDPTNVAYPRLLAVKAAAVASFVHQARGVPGDPPGPSQVVASTTVDLPLAGDYLVLGSVRANIGNGPVRARLDFGTPIRTFDFTFPGPRMTTSFLEVVHVDAAAPKAASMTLQSQSVAIDARDASLLILKPK